MLKNLIAVSIGLFMAIAAVEFVGHVFPDQIGFKVWAANLHNSPQMSSYTRYHPVIGYEVDPDSGDFVYERYACIKSGPVTITTEGTRKTGPQNSAKPAADGPRIAVLGDSMTMAREVGDYEHFSALLQKLVPASTVTNYGTLGYNTIQEYLTYSVKAANTEPDIVVLAFLEVNDVMESHRRLAEFAPLTRFRPFMAADSDEIFPPAVTPEEAAKEDTAMRRLNSALLQNSFTYHVIRYLLETASGGSAKESPAGRPAGAADTDYWWETGPTWLGVYQNPPDAVFEAAWHDVERTLVKLNEEVERRGSDLVVLFLPMTEFRGIEPSLKDYAKQFDGDEPPGFDRGYPAARLKKFGAANGIDVLDLTPQFESYMEQHDLQPPTFNFNCDGHYNPIGHYLTANGLAEHFLQRGLVDENAIRRTPDYLNQTPEDLLGREAYNAIFTEGNVYTGNSLLNAAP